MKKKQKQALQKELISTIFSTSRKIYKRISDSKIVCFGSPLQRETLRFIMENDGCVMKEVANYLQITPPSATSMTNNLVKAGVIKRQADKRDRRTIRLFITKKGEKTLSTGIQHMSKRLSKLSTGEQKNLIKILNKIATIQAKD
jgi:DNA-binding MarR family transcriptional regulator